MLQEHLAIAERHIALGVKLLAKQEALIAELERHSHDTKGARDVLATMVENAVPPYRRPGPHLEGIGTVGPLI